MANVRITGLPVLSTMTDAAVMPVVAGNVTQQISGANLKTYFASGGNASTGNFVFDGNVVNMPLTAQLNSGGIGNTNAAEFGTEVYSNGTAIYSSQIYMGAGTTEIRGIVDSSGAGLMYAGVEGEGFAGIVGMDPGVTSQYAIAVGTGNTILLGVTTGNGTITTTEYTAGVGALNANGTINGLLASSSNVVISNGNTAGWSFSADGELTTPQGGRLGGAGKGWQGLDGGLDAPVSVTSYYANGFYAGCFSAYPDGNVNISTYTGDGQQGSWNFDNTGNLTTSGNIITSGPTGNITGANVISATTITATGNITGGNIRTAGAGGDVALTGGNITGANVITANTITANSLFNGTSNISIIANSSIQMFTPVFDTNLGAVNLVGTTNGNSVAPQNPGVMLHLTGVTGTPARIYNDSVANYAGFVGRRYDGTADAPVAISANAIISRYAATPYTSAGWPDKSSARIDMVTNEAQTATNQGTEIQFWTTPVGSNTIAKVMSMTNNDIKIDGDLAATGNATFSTNIDYINQITVSGITYDAQVVIHDISADNVAQLILTRDSTSVQPILATALNNSDDPTVNVDVVLGQTLFQIATLGFAGTDYKEFGAIAIRVDDSGTVSETSSPGLIELRVTPDGSTSTNTAVTIRNDSSAEFAGNVTAANFVGNTAGYAIGYRDIPPVNFSGNTTTATTDAGKHYYSTQSTDYILTIANNASQGFQVGAAISVVNQGTGNITVAQGSGVTLYLAGNGTSGNRTVSTFGMATLIKVDTDTWFINGTGVS